MTAPVSLRRLLESGPLIAPGVFDGVSARVAVRSGAKALYMTGFGVAGSLLGVPDIGIVTANEMSDRVRALCAAAAPTPVIADGDNGHGGIPNVERLVREYEHAGAAAIQLEDQVLPKRCGHMEGKEVVPLAEAAAKIRAAAGTRASKEFLIIARTDARSVNGLDDALHRADAFLKAGADLLFVEAPQSEAELRTIAERFKGVPLVANMVEDGKTPRLSVSELASLGCKLVIYPVSALLAAAKSYERVYGRLLSNQVDATDERITFQDYNGLMGLNEYLRRSQ